ncbi:MAG TPA: hypothetical protein VF251_10240 [Pyrinomonadaceae bacterium]
MAKTMTKKPGSGSSNKKSAGLPPIPLPGVTQAAGTAHAGAKAVLAADVIDFDNAKLKPGWQKIIDSRRKRFETDVLKITPPRSRLDPIAKTALDRLTATLLKAGENKKDGFGKLTPAELENRVRITITKQGLATEVKKVTDRLNARRMTDGRRWVLTTTYTWLLAKLFHKNANSLKKLMNDDLGVAERIMLDLEKKDGPIEVYTDLIINSVMARNRIQQSETLVKIVSQQVRAAI